MHHSSQRVLLAIAVFLLLLVPGAALGVGPSFSDVPTSDWAYDDIEWLAATGVTQGCGEGEYCPDAPVTRREMAAFVHRLATYQVVDAATIDGFTASELQGPQASDYYTAMGYVAASTKGVHVAEALCRSGDVATGGGVEIHDDPLFRLDSSMPMNPAGESFSGGWTPTGWRASALLDVDLENGHWGLRVWAICTDMSP